VAEGEVLVGEGAGAVDAGAAGAVAVQEVAALDHEVFDLIASTPSVRQHSVVLACFGGKGGERRTDDAVEFAPFVALRSPLRVLRLARAELPEVFRRFGRRVAEELHLDAAEGFACEGGGGVVRGRGGHYVGLERA